MKTWDEKIPLIESLLNDSEIMEHFDEEELKSLFSYDKVFESIDYIFKRTGLEE